VNVSSRRSSDKKIRMEKVWLMAVGGWLAAGADRRGYGAVVEYLAAECRRYGTSIHLGAAATAVDTGHGRIAARCRDGAILEGDAAIFSVPVPLLSEIVLPPRPTREGGGGQHRNRIWQCCQNSAAIRNRVVGYL
jgi:phytoene dehydrogenase-like protein